MACRRSTTAHSIKYDGGGGSSGNGGAEGVGGSSDAAGTSAAGTSWQTRRAAGRSQSPSSSYRASSQGKGADEPRSTDGELR